MNGIKNYLVQHGEDELNQIIEAERSKVSATCIVSSASLITQYTR